MFAASFFQFLWSLTLIGGVIKRYSYFLVPYIAAENPDVRALEAVTLSRRMMRGHKWECFLMEMSFLGWVILGGATLGISEIFYSNPYRMGRLCGILCPGPGNLQEGRGGKGRAVK